MAERRRHVRVRPSVDCDIEVELLSEPLGPLQVVDVSLGGVGFIVSEALVEREPGDTLDVRIKLPRQLPFALEVTVRHNSRRLNGVCGVEFTKIDDDCRAKFRRYFSELFERGMSI